MKTNREPCARAERAEALFREGYNCCQAVVGAFADVLGMDMETAMRLSSSFGGGIGRMREVCGAVSGMAMVAGLLYGPGDLSDPSAKGEHYKLVQKLAGKFREENGSIVCRELLEGVSVTSGATPEERTIRYYEKRPCAEYVKCAAQILEEEINSRSLAQD